MNNFASIPTEGVAPFNKANTYQRGQYFRNPKNPELLIADGKGGYHKQGTVEAEAIYAEVVAAKLAKPAIAQPTPQPREDGTIYNPDSGKRESVDPPAKPIQPAPSTPAQQPEAPPILEVLKAMQAETAFAANERFTRYVLNRQPAPADIKVESSEKGGMRHIPIHTLRAKLDEVFGGQARFSEPKFQLIHFPPMADGSQKILIVCTMTLTVTYPVTGFRRTVYGVSTSATGASYKNSPKAAEVAAAKAEKIAISNLGIYFGRDLNKDRVKTTSVAEKVQAIEARRATQDGK